MNTKTKFLLLMVALVLVTGCRGSLSRQLKSLADEPSIQRLDLLPEDTDLLISLHSETVLGELPDLGDEGRELGRFGSAVLLEVKRSRVFDLLDISNLTEMVLWGDEQAITRLDPMLRNELLSSMALPYWREGRYDVIATFTLSDDEISSLLADTETTVGSVNAGVATFSAPAETLFDILAGSGLVQLKKPVLQR